MHRCRHSWYILLVYELFKVCVAKCCSKIFTFYALLFVVHKKSISTVKFGLV